jgi:hypothetical protein
MYTSRRAEGVVQGRAIGPDFCRIDINTSALLSYREQSDVVAACVLADPTVGASENPLVATSGKFKIDGDRVTIEYPFTEKMKARSLRGQLVSHTVILLPKGVDPKAIRRLSDVRYLGGIFR